MCMQHRWDDTDRGNGSTRSKTRPRVALATTNRTQGLCGGRLMTTCPRVGTAITCFFMIYRVYLFCKVEVAKYSYTSHEL